MSFGSFGFLSLTTPSILLGLLALPIIWWLLRFTPPRPQTVNFPPTRLFLSISSRDQTPMRSPWWLTLLRIVIATAIIAALAGPFLRPIGAISGMTVAKPILVVVDNGWAAASRWEKRRIVAEEISALAEKSGQSLYLGSTTDITPITPLTPSAFRQKFEALQPKAYPGDRKALARQVDKDLTLNHDKLNVIWMADGIDEKESETLSHSLKAIAIEGAINIYLDEESSGALGLFHADNNSGGAIKARILKANTVYRAGTLSALTMKGEKLGVVSFDIAPAQNMIERSIELPLELRNQVARIEIEQDKSAGSTFLLDSRSQRRRVGIVAGEDAEQAQPLLSTTHYLEKAISLHADVILARTANIDQATADLVNRNPSVIILSDVGKLVGNSYQRLATFIEKGGTLIRFAGTRLEQGSDDLLPVALRQGERTLGGSLTWASPQGLAPFDQGSPFSGLHISNDVTVSRQVLADPTRMTSEVEVWSRLADSTPLVTSIKKGKGRIIFFHITANPDWSNLPLSGLFVDMMRKAIELSPIQGATVETSDQKITSSSSSSYTLLKPWRLLDGFGRLVDANVSAQNVTSAQTQTMVATSSTPAGYYGQNPVMRAVNVLSDADRLNSLKTPPDAHIHIYNTGSTIIIAPWLYLIALILFLMDGVINLRPKMRLGNKRFASHAAMAFAVFVIGPLFSIANVRAETLNTPEPVDEASHFALEASLQTRLAYVLTGDAEADMVSQAGLSGLSKILMMRTAVEPGTPMAIDPARDELAFFSLIYWPVLPNAEALSDSVLAKIDAYMKQGGMIVFDTKNDDMTSHAFQNGTTNTTLSRLIGKLDLPPLQRIPENHILTKSFYLLQAFPGRWDNNNTWVQSQPGNASLPTQNTQSDGVSPIIVTSNDLAAAWAVDDADRPMFAVIPGGEEQREMSYRVGVNIVMYALTGNYKADQVHVPIILGRLGH